MGDRCQPVKSLGPKAALRVVDFPHVTEPLLDAGIHLSLGSTTAVVADDGHYVDLIECVEPTVLILALKDVDDLGAVPTELERGVVVAECLGGEDDLTGEGLLYK